MHQNSLLVFQKHAARYFDPSLRVLEIGPTGSPSAYQGAVNGGGGVWDTLDLFEAPHLTYTATDEYTFPISDDAYDIVLSGNVIEHVRAIWRWLPEVARITKPGGLVITINPVSWPYHAYPTDCWRPYPDGMRALYEDAGLDVLTSTFESLEGKRYPNHVPGTSAGYFAPRWRKRLTRALGRLGAPVTCAYDTVTIGRKIGPPRIRCV